MRQLRVEEWCSERTRPVNLSCACVHDIIKIGKFCMCVSIAALLNVYCVSIYVCVSVEKSRQTDKYVCNLIKTTLDARACSRGIFS